MKLFADDLEFSSLGVSTFEYLSSVVPSLQTVVTETEYLDKDFTAAYIHFYGSLFKPPPRTCTRYLFFCESFSDISSLQNQRIIESFKGFLVVWPTYPPVIGRSVLPFPESLGSRDNMIRSDTDYEVYVAGVRLSIKSAVFASKDHAVSACATVATWLAVDLMHNKFGLRGSSTTEITLLATDKQPKWGRPIPQTTGLDIEQITKALTSLEYAPRVHYFDPKYTAPIESRSWLGLLYGYVLSGLPVIIMCDIYDEKDKYLGAHSILAIGIQPSCPIKNKQEEGGVRQKSNSKNVEYVLAHDDRWGAFARIVPVERSIVTQITYPSGRSVRLEVSALIISLPVGVNLYSEEAHSLGSRYISTWFEVNLGYNYQGSLQTKLMRSEHLKEEALTWNYEAAANEIREIAMPEWVWVTEALEIDSYLKKKGETRGESVVARAILDASQLKYNKKQLFIGGHLYSSIIPYVVI
ncbi:hypothetical protein ACFLUB_00410 [Chloroflexota bacterium]